MANIAAVLKEEIRRLARREIKAGTSGTKRAVAQYRREIAQLKRQIRAQERAIADLRAQDRSREVRSDAAVAADGGQKQRFSARSVRAQRKRLGLSAEDYGKLVGVSPLTVYHWEHGKSRPRKVQFAALVALRGIGKREARRQLDEKAAAAKRTHRKLRMRKPR